MEMEKFKDDLKSLGKRVTKLKENIATEEATKTSFNYALLSNTGL